MLDHQDGHEPGLDTPDEKHAANLIVLFARTGASVHRLADGGFVVCRWAYSRHCQDLRELDQVARQMGVVR